MCFFLFVLYFLHGTEFVSANVLGNSYIRLLKKIQSCTLISVFQINFDVTSTIFLQNYTLIGVYKSVLMLQYFYRIVSGLVFTNCFDVTIRIFLQHCTPD